MIDPKVIIEIISHYPPEKIDKTDADSHTALHYLSRQIEKTNLNKTPEPLLEPVALLIEKKADTSVMNLSGYSGKLEAYLQFCVAYNYYLLKNSQKALEWNSCSAQNGYFLAMWLLGGGISSITQKESNGFYQLQQDNQNAQHAYYWLEKEYRSLKDLSRSVSILTLIKHENIIKHMTSCRFHIETPEADKSAAIDNAIISLREAKKSFGEEFKSQNDPPYITTQKELLTTYGALLQLDKQPLLALQYYLKAAELGHLGAAERGIELAKEQKKLALVTTFYERAIQNANQRGYAILSANLLADYESFKKTNAQELQSELQQGAQQVSQQEAQQESKQESKRELQQESKQAWSHTSVTPITNLPEDPQHLFERVHLLLIKQQQGKELHYLLKECPDKPSELWQNTTKEMLQQQIAKSDYNFGYLLVSPFNSNLRQVLIEHAINILLINKPLEAANLIYQYVIGAEVKTSAHIEAPKQKREELLSKAIQIYKTTIQQGQEKRDNKI